MDRGAQGSARKHLRGVNKFSENSPTPRRLARNDIDYALPILMTVITITGTITGVSLHRNLMAPTRGLPKVDFKN